MFKKSKYGNKKTNGYDSKKEAKRAFDLEILSKKRLIKNLQTQVRFELQPSFKDNHGKTERAITYVADFVYLCLETNRLICEDVKGFKTETYKIKKKLFKFKYPQYTFIES